MQDKLKHSPTPWRFLIKPYTNGVEYSVEQKEAGHLSLFDNEIYENRAPSIEDAEFIVRCVNSHQALFTALKDVMDDLKSRAKWDDDVKTIPLGVGAFERAEAALALAGGESE